MINEKSLENLRGPKPRKEGHGYRYALPQEKIDELFMHLADGLSLKKAAKNSKICFETAKKYFRKGDEKRGIKPLQYRLTVFQDHIYQKLNVLATERRMELIGTIRKAIDQMKTRIEAGDLLNKPNLNQLDKLVRLEIFLLGGVTQKERKTKMLSAEEISGDHPEG
jgi:hypothetical protein